MKSLDQIAIDKGTDKSSLIHNYCVKYEKYFPFDRNAEIKILEIGIFNGQSLLTWREFYPNAIIVGIDIEPKCKQYENTDQNIFVEIGSQTDYGFLKRVTDKYGEFDLILDDGSHLQSHMIASFEFLFDFVKNQGLYVIEDILKKALQSNTSNH